MSIPGAANPLLLATAAAGGYSISRSLRFNSADSAYLSRTPASAGNRRTWTYAFWAKITDANFTSNATISILGANSSSQDFITLYNRQLRVSFNTASSGDTFTNAQLRDPAAWYHIVVAVDTTQATDTNRLKVYLNGVAQTFSYYGAPPLNYQTNINNATAQYLGYTPYYNTYFNGYLADIHFIDGQALDPTSFGEFDDNGIWQPIAYSGSYGTNGFHLDFADNSSAAALGTDTSGNGNTCTVNNLSVTAGAGNDSLVDVPTNGSEVDTGAGGQVRGNYATLNPLDRHTSITLANGNLDAQTTDANWRSVRGNIGMSSGKWYWEITLGSATYNVHGIGLASAALDAYPGSSAGSYGWIYNGTLSGGSSTGTGAAYGTVIAFAFNADTGRLDLYNDGTLLSGYFSGLPAGTYFPMFGVYGPSIGLAQVNFGQRPFAYTAPSGFKALCTANLPAPVVTKPSTVMDVALYTGTGSSQSITGLGFSPDLVWIKNRTDSGSSHALFDAVRGTDKRLRSNGTDAELSPAIYGSLTAFNSNGFTVAPGSDPTDPAIETCKSSKAYVGWCWDAGSSTVTNTQGSISSQVRANPSAGFSIVTYTGNGTSSQTVGHGLGAKPGLIIVKVRSISGYNWGVYHSSLTGTQPFIKLNSTDAVTQAFPSFQPALNTSAVFGIGNEGTTNDPGATYVAYCFAPVAGYSSMGSYVANGTSDNAFCYTGFRPRFLLLKASSTTGSWLMVDSARASYNLVTSYLLANASDAEGTADSVDFLSNGFKVRTSVGGIGVNGNTVIWAAFAESPFQYARAR
jgi:hypothetical protein